MQRRATTFAPAICVAMFAAQAALALPANADPSGGTVTGGVDLPPRSERAKLPTRGTGFTERIKGPLKEPKGFDPRSQIVVVLTGGPVHGPDAKPPKQEAVYAIVGESFKTAVFPFVIGTKVQIKNDSDVSRRLYAVGNDDAIDGAPVKDTKRPIKTPETAFESLEVRDRDSAHLSGHLVAMPHSYFSVLGSNGSYSISGVPAGKWTVSLWYQGALLALPKQTVTVVAGRPAKAPTVKLPAKMPSNTKPETN